MPVNEQLLHGWFFGNVYVREAAAVAFAFLMGSIPLGAIFAWLFCDLDPRLASTARGFVPLFSLGKAALPTAVAAHGGGLAVGLCAGLAAVAGDCFCPWLKFRGGTGIAAELGVLAVLCWPAAAIFATLWLVAATSSNYSTVGALLASAFTFVSLWFFLGVAAAFCGVAIALAIAFRHRENVLRLRDGREPTMREGARPTAARLRVRRNQPIQSV